MMMHAGNATVSASSHTPKFLQNSIIGKCLLSSVTKNGLNTLPYFSYIDIAVCVEKPGHLPDFPPILIRMVSDLFKIEEPLKTGTGSSLMV